MSGGTSVSHRDSDYLASGSHTGAESGILTIDGEVVYIDGETVTIGAAGASGDPVLIDNTFDFKSNGIIVGQYIENLTSGENSLVASVTEDEITTDDNLTWQNGDEYKIYKTSTKNGFISSQWTDLTRGIKSDKVELIGGWLAADIDIDNKGRSKIFGPGQPSKDY